MEVNPYFLHIFFSLVAENLYVTNCEVVKVLIRFLQKRGRPEPLLYYSRSTGRTLGRKTGAPEGCGGPEQTGRMRRPSTCFHTILQAQHFQRIGLSGFPEW